MASIVLNNNAIIYLSQAENDKDKIIIKIKDSRNRFFEDSYDFDFLKNIFDNDIEPKQFFEYLENNHPTISNANQENEIILEIKAKRNIKLIIKEIGAFNNTFKLKETDKGTPNDDEDNINNESEILTHLKLTLEKNEFLILNNSDISKNTVNFVYINKNKNLIYKISQEFDNTQELYKSLNKNKPKIEENNNENEIKLNIIYENKHMIIILKEISLIYNEEIEQLKELYYEKIKKMKQENEKLYAQSQQLKEKIDKEKIKNDEIVRIYLKNREKYEQALKKYDEIKKLSLDIDS